MSLKDLFESTKVTKSGSADETAYEVESEAYTEAFAQDKNEYLPPVDFSTASNFARYGSAAKYYEDSIQRIYNEYPYDGSRYEVLDFHNSSSFLDRWMLEYKYPRTTGYISIGTTSGSGDWHTKVSESNGVGGYGMPDTSSNNILEYIEIKGGPNTGSADRTFEAQDVSLKKLFTFSNVYDSGSAREYNLEYDLGTGMTIEFWMLKNDFYTSKTEREVVFDLWNNVTPGTVDGDGNRHGHYGRLMVEIIGTDTEGSSIRLTAQSGTTGFVNEPIASIAPSEIADGVWKHYAITLKNHPDDNGVNAKLYINGQMSGSAKLGSAGLGRVTGSMLANIGALIAPPNPTVAGFYDSTTIAKGAAKLSASLDEFRFWKLERDARQIGRHWFTQVGAGTNTDTANVGLGVYYKFNEGIMNSGSRDFTILDYSGRISNGHWYGGTSECRNSGSAIASGSHNRSEFHDPIIYSEHPDVEYLETSMVTSGSHHDNLNNSLITSNFPDWIDTESRETTLKHFTQIFASYFDKLYLQIDGLSKIKERYGTSYATGDVSASFKPVPFAKSLVTQFGITVPEILQEAELIENFFHRNEAMEYEEKLYNIRNQIYSNIYANLLYIFKTKGTEKSLRNMLRCFGIDDELVKINAYADNGDYVFKDNRRATANKTNYVSFNHADRVEGSIYQQVKMSVEGVYDQPNAAAYITGSSTFGKYNAQTIECEVFLPRKTEDILHPNYYQDYFITASMFGVMGHDTGQNDPYDTRNFEDTTVDFQVLVLKDELESRRARFMLKSSVLGDDEDSWLITDYYEDVYDDTRWNFAVRVKPISHPFMDHAKVESSLGGGWSQGFDVEFYGVNVFTDVVQHEFLKTTTISKAKGEAWLSAPKRCYVGAYHEHRPHKPYRSVCIHQSNVEIGNLRYWISDISDEVVRAHAFDQSSFGVASPYKNVFVYQTDVSGTHVPQIETLALHWNFDNVTGSGPSPTDVLNTKDAQFIVQDISSGSAANVARYNGLTGSILGEQIHMQHLGVGDFFLENDNKVVNTRYIPTAKVVLPEYLHSSDMVEIRQRDTEFFTMETRPSKVYYSIEKSMYQTISEEMVKMFASIKDFDNLIGEPVNRYRHEYKDLGKLRQLFFEKIPNTPDLDKYVDYYKWIDSAVSKFLEDLFPASAEHSDGMQTMVESHMLERNKYQTKYPTLEMAKDPPAASFDTINTLLYDYKRGSAPLPGDIPSPLQQSHTDHKTAGSAEMMDQDQNCLWWNKRAERHHPILARIALSHSLTIGADGEFLDIADADRGSIELSGSFTSRIAIFSASTSAYQRMLHTPYHYTVVQSRVIHGGINYDDNKKLDYVYPATVPFSPRGVDYGKFGGYPLGYLLAKDMDRDASPSASLPQCDMPLSSSYGAKVKREGYKVIDGWEGFKSAAQGQSWVAAIPASGSITITNATDFYGMGAGTVFEITTTDGTVVTVSQHASTTTTSDTNSPTYARSATAATAATNLAACINGNSKLTATAADNVVTITQTVGGIAGNRAIIATGSWGSTVGAQVIPIQGGQEGVTQTPNWESGSYHHFRANLVMPFNVISSSKDDVNEGYTRLVNQDLTVWGGGTGVGHSTDAGTYVNHRSKRYGTYESRNNGDNDDFSSHTYTQHDTTATELGGMGRGVNLVNLHTDTYGEDKEVPMQGPFTEKYVGGRIYRHAEVNDGTDTLKTRMEGWLVLINTAIMTPNGVLHATSGGVGLTGPDYPYPHGPYPFQPDDGGGGQSIHWRPIGGRYYRDEMAKRPVNIRNIQMVTQSATPTVIGEHRVDVISVDSDGNPLREEHQWTKHYHEQIATGSARTIIGNYRHNYEVVHTVGRSNQKPFLRDNQSVRNILQTGSFAAAPSIKSTGADNAPRSYGDRLAQTISEDLLGNGSLPASTHIETILTQKFQSTGSKDFEDTAAAEDEHIVPTLTHLTGAVLVGARVIVSDVSGGVGGANAEAAARHEDNYSILPTPDMHLNMDHRIQDRSSGSTNLNTIIANRFSAPGGPRNQSKGFLDLAAEEYSVYNAYPWRNLEVLGSSSGEQYTTKASIHDSTDHPRLGLRSLRALPSGRFGAAVHFSSSATPQGEQLLAASHADHGIVIASAIGIQERSEDYTLAPSWHKIHRNGRLARRAATAANNGGNAAVEGRKVAYYVRNHASYDPAAGDTVIVQTNAPRRISIISYMDDAPADGETIILLEKPDTPRPARAEFIFSSKPPEGSTFKITDSAGTFVTFEVDADNDGASGDNVALDTIKLRGDGGVGMALDLVQKINARTDLDIVASSPADGAVVLVQGTIGSGGNTAIVTGSSESTNTNDVWHAAATVKVPSSFTDAKKTYFKWITKTTSPAHHSDQVETKTGTAWDPYLLGIETTGSYSHNNLNANFTSLRNAITASTNFVVSDVRFPYGIYYLELVLSYPENGPAANSFDYGSPDTKYGTEQATGKVGTYFEKFTGTGGNPGIWSRRATYGTVTHLGVPTVRYISAQMHGAKIYYKWATTTATNYWDSIDDGLALGNGYEGSHLLVPLPNSASDTTERTIGAMQAMAESIRLSTYSLYGGTAHGNGGSYPQFDIGHTTLLPGSSNHYVGMPITYLTQLGYDGGQYIDVGGLSANSIDFSTETDGTSWGTIFARSYAGILHEHGNTVWEFTPRRGHDGTETLENFQEHRVYDNDYVTRPIPQNDYQYAWISASLAPSGSTSAYYNLGHGYSMQGFNHPTPSGSRPPEPILFISASEVGSAWNHADIIGSNGPARDGGGKDTDDLRRVWGLDKNSIAAEYGASDVQQHIPNVHRLNLNIRDDQNNWLTDGSGAVALGFYASGGILPANKSLPIDHGHTPLNPHGAAHASQLANIHNYVNWHIANGEHANRFLGSQLSSPDNDVVYEQGARIGLDDNAGWDSLEEPMIRYDALPEYASSSDASTGFHDQDFTLNQSIAGIFNGLMWKRNGPYGYPTWKQIRGGEHILAQTMRKNNRYVVVDPKSDRVIPPKQGTWGPVVSLNSVQTFDVVSAFRRSGHVNTAERKHNHYYVPVVETNAKTMLAAIQRGQLSIDTITLPQGAGTITNYSIDPDKMLYANVTHVNNLKNFPRWKLNEDLGIRNYKSDRTAYNDLYEMYTEMTDMDGNDAYTLVDLTYRETIYPKSKNAGRGDIRQRSNFDVGYWAGDADKEYRGKTDHTDLYSYHEPIGRRTHFNNPDIHNPHGAWEFARGPNASLVTVGWKWSAGTPIWSPISVFNTDQGYSSTKGISKYHEEKNRNVLWYSGSIWPMDGGKDISLFGAEYNGTMGPQQFLASSSHRASNPGYAEGFYFDGLQADVLTHGAPGILQNQFTWFHNGMSIGFEPTSISSSNQGDYGTTDLDGDGTHDHDDDHGRITRYAVASSSVMTNDDFYALALKVGKIREDSLGKHILTERWVAQAAAGLAFGPSYSRPHMMVGRDSYCSPSAGKAAYSRRFNFTSTTDALTGALSYGKGTGVAPFLQDIKPRGDGEGTGTTIPITASQMMAGGAPSVLLDMGNRVVSQLTRSIGHQVEGLYVSDWQWKAPLQSGKAPFYANYSQWFEELRGKSQDRQVIPEYRISDRMSYFVLDKQGRFTSRDREWLTLLGNPSASHGHLTSSADAVRSGDRVTGSFMSDYAVTATPALLDAIKKENAGIAEPYELTLTCDAIVKFLPYQGFYPQLRTVDLCKQFIDSYDEHVTFESDMDINDLPSSFVRVDSSGSVNPLTTSPDRFGWSPFGPGGGLLGRSADGNIATAHIMFDNSTYGDTSENEGGTSGWAVPDMTFMVIDDPTAKKRIAIVFNRTEPITSWGTYTHATGGTTEQVGADAGGDRGATDASTTTANQDGENPKTLAGGSSTDGHHAAGGTGNDYIDWRDDTRYGRNRAGATTNITSIWDPIGPKMLGFTNGTNYNASDTLNGAGSYTDTDYDNGEYTMVYNVRANRAGRASLGAAYWAWSVVQSINHARHNGLLNVSCGTPEYAERDNHIGKQFQGGTQSTWSTNNRATVLTLKYDTNEGSDGVSTAGTGGTAGNAIKVNFYSWNNNLETTANPTPPSAGGSPTNDGTPTTSKAFRWIPEGKIATGDDSDLDGWSATEKTFYGGTDGVAEGLMAAQFYSNASWSGYSFDTDEILDPTLPRVGGSGQLTAKGFETHGRNPAAAKRPFYGPFMAPGILFNTIKSGIAVDYPVLHRKLATTASVDRDGGRNFQIVNEYFDNRLPFETLVEPEKYLTNVPLIDMEPHPSASINVTASWNGQGDPLYKMMMHNFLAEIPNFYLADQSMQSFVSLPESDGGFGQVEMVVHNGVEVIPEYRMMVKLFKSQENNIRRQTPSASNHWQNHRGPKLPYKIKAHDGTHSGTLIYNGRYEPCYYTDIIGMQNHGNNSDGGYAEGWYPDMYLKGFGVNYNRKEVSYPRPQSDAPETITMYSRPSAFGPPCAGGYAIEPEFEFIYTGSVAPFSQSYDPGGTLGDANLNADAGTETAYTDGYPRSDGLRGHFGFGQQFVEGHVAGSGTIGKVADRSMSTYGMKDGTNGYNAPFTPPYYDGQAWAFITFKPTRTGKHYLDEIWEKTTINFLRYEFDYISGAYGDWGTYGPQGYAMNVNAMQLDAAVNIKGKTSIKEVTYDAVTGLPQTVQDSLQNTARNSAWVIQTKLETPILHFGYGLTDNQTALALSGSDSTSTMAESNGYHHGYAGLCEPIGMWHQYGEIPSASQGIYLEVADIPPAYMRFGTEMTIANPKWMHITGSPDMTVGSTAGVTGYMSGSGKSGDIAGALTWRQGAPDWDGWSGTGSFDECLVVADPSDTATGHQQSTTADKSSQPKFLMGQGYRFSGSFSGSETAYTVGADTIAQPDLVRQGILERGGRQQYMRWRLMSTGSLAGIIADMTHLQIVSADDGTILDTTWGCPINRSVGSTPGISGSGPCFERGYYIDLTVTGSNIVSGSAHAGGQAASGDLGEDDEVAGSSPAHDNQWTSLNRGYPGTSSMRQQLMGIGKLDSSFTMHRSPDAADGDPIENITIPYRNYYLQWIYDVPNNPKINKFAMARSYLSPLHKNKRGVIPDPPHFSNNIGTASFGTALGATFYSHVYDNTHPTLPANVGYATVDFDHPDPQVVDVTRYGPTIGRAFAGNSYDSTNVMSNSVGVGRAEIICGYTSSEGRYGFDSDGQQITSWDAGDGNPAPPSEPYKWTKTIDGPLSSSARVEIFKWDDELSTPAYASYSPARFYESGRKPRYPNGNMMASNLTHGETSYQRWASDYYFTGDGGTGGDASDTDVASGSGATIGIPGNVNGFHGRTGGTYADGTAAGWYGGGLEDIYPLGQTGMPGPSVLQNGLGTHNSRTDNNADMTQLDPIKMWYTNPVHIANVRMQDMFVRDFMISNNPHRAHKVIDHFQDLEAALCSPRTVPSGKFQPRSGVQALTRSLGSLVGFESGAKKLGQLAEFKKVKEAVIVMPYVVKRGRRRFVQLDDQQVDRYFGRGDFKNTAYWAAIEKFKDLKGTAVSPISGLQVNLGNSVLRQIRIMGDYVIPPHLDFITNETAKPYAMYIFEYEHQFSAQDLSDMWQGLYPDSGHVMKQVTKQVTHKLNILELLGGAAEDGEGIPNKLRFMVFKVKQRAAINYFQQTKNQLDDQRFRFKFKAGAATKSVNYSYNWPYDFFSLVETAKIDMSVMLRNEKLVEDVELQELNERFTITPVVTSVSDLFKRRAGIMRRMSVTAAAIRSAKRLATKTAAKAAVTAKYGPVRASSQPAPSPSMGPPIRTAPKPFGGVVK